MLEIKRKCIICGYEKIIKVPEEQYNDWKAGLFIQEAMPNIPANDREFLLSGICPNCFDVLLAEEAE